MGTLSNIENLIREGCLSGALAAVKLGVRQFPADIGIRRVFFTLLAASGEWERCRQQAEALSRLEAVQSDWISVMGILSACEKRDRFWSGSGTVRILGDPAGDDRLLLDAAIGAAGGMIDPVDAPAFGPGCANDKPFALLGTADDRLPGVLEVSMDGAYHWLWLGSVRRIETAVRRGCITDAKWIPARVVLADGTRHEVTVFGSYPGTESSASERTRLGMDLCWKEDFGDAAVGEGPQILIVDEKPLLIKDLHLLEFDDTEIDQARLMS